MKLMLLVLIPLGFLVGCEQQQSDPVLMPLGWDFVGYTPNGPGYWNGIYKQHKDQDKVTVYATPVRGGWSISVVKD